MSGRTAIRVAMLMGGPSSEREVSLVTGQMCSAALREQGYDVTEVDAGRGLAGDLQKIAPDAAFNALHGRWGEDGCVQGILEWLQIPYTHSGVTASALAMDKELTKRLVFKHAGLPTPEGRVIEAAELDGAHPLAPPYVLKPVNEGSSVGVVIVRGRSAQPPLTADQPFGRLIVEKFIPGRELTVTVLGENALTVTEIVTPSWYDYEAKYALGGSRHIVPAQIPGRVFDKCMEYAETAHRALGCRGLSRTDFRWDDSKGADGLFLLETNTQPGMTPTSLSPEQADHCSFSFPELCRSLIEDASCQR